MKQKDALKILKAGKNVYRRGRKREDIRANEYISYLKNRGVSAGITASTGIAATHIGGVTIHSWSGVGIKDTLDDRDIEHLVSKEHLYKRFEKTKVLVIDEVSMLSSRLFDSVERVCRAMKRSEEPFGGMQVVLSGDFFQLPPISAKAGKRNLYINRRRGEKWTRVCYLDEQFRHSDSSLEKILNEMRSGSVSPETQATLRKMCDEKSLEAKSVAPTRLYTHNADVDAENDKELNKLPGASHAYEMSSKGKSVNSGIAQERNTGAGDPAPKEKKQW